MQTALLASAALMGLAGMPHCAAMCSAPCAAALGRHPTHLSSATFQMMRLVGYAVAGAAVASAVGGLAALTSWAPAWRPLWTLLHAGALMLGLWLLWQGRQPEWLGAMGRKPEPSAASMLSMPGAPLWRAAGAGGLWALWPCGLLQSALLVAALAGDAATGAGVMAVFAVTSAPGLLLGPWLARRLSRAGGEPGMRDRFVTRVAGALLIVASVFALGHGLWSRIAVYCGFG